MSADRKEGALNSLPEIIAFMLCSFARSLAGLFAFACLLGEQRRRRKRRRNCNSPSSVSHL